MATPPPRYSERRAARRATKKKCTIPPLSSSLSTCHESGKRHSHLISPGIPGGAAVWTCHVCRRVQKLLCFLSHVNAESRAMQKLLPKILAQNGRVRRVCERAAPIDVWCLFVLRRATYLPLFIQTRRPERMTTNKVTLSLAEKHLADYMADLYAAIVSLERLERAYHRDLVDKAAYEAAVVRLLDRQDTICNQLRTAARGAFTDLDSFMSQYDLERSCAAAKVRIDAGHPCWKRPTSQVGPNASASSSSSGGTNSGGSNASSNGGGGAAATASTAPMVQPKVVLEAAQHFITIMDCLKLKQTAADQLHPLLTDLTATVKGVNPGFEHLTRLEGWLTKMDTMRASDELNEVETREMLFDVERAYQAFYRYLSGIGAPAVQQQATAS